MLHAISAADKIALKIGLYIAIFVVIFLIRLGIRAIRQALSKPKATAPAVPLPAAPPVPAKPVVRNPVLRGITGMYAGADIPLDDKPVVIGRDPDVASLVFPADTRVISGRHCILKVYQNRFYLEDCWSTNGTFLDGGKALPPGQAQEISPGARFYLGDQTNVFEVNFR